MGAVWEYIFNAGDRHSAALTPVLGGSKRLLHAVANNQRTGEEETRTRHV